MARHGMELEEGWNIISKGITKLTNLLEGPLEGLPQEQFNAAECMTYYTTVFNICANGNNDSPRRLYGRYKRTIQQYINTMVLPPLREKHGELLLRELLKRMHNHKILVHWLSRFFSYLERPFHAFLHQPPLRAIGFMCFRDQVYAEMESRTIDALVALNAQEREGKKVDHDLLKQLRVFFVEIGIDNDSTTDAYERHIAFAIFGDTVAYYSERAASWMDKYFVVDYLLKGKECIDKEMERAVHHLHPTYRPKLFEEIKGAFLAEYSKQSLEDKHSVCNTADDTRKQFAVMCSISNAFPNEVAVMFEQHVISEGAHLMKQAEKAYSKSRKAQTKDARDKTFLTAVLDIHEKYVGELSEYFMDDPVFANALKLAFEVLCEDRFTGSSGAELLATFFDSIVKDGGIEGFSHEDIENTIEKVVKLIDYVDDKDMFAEFYREKLALRLLFDTKGLINDLELIILRNLGTRFGAPFTMKMSRMVSDFTRSRAAQESFEHSLQNNSTCNPAIDFTVTMLSREFWPNFKSPKIILPAEMQRFANAFSDFYGKTAKNRKLLTWVHCLGECAMNVHFESKMIELIVTPCQAAVLLLFNEADQLSYGDVKGQLNLGDEDVRRLLHSLSCGEHKILKKNPITMTVTPADSFEFNSNFTHGMQSINTCLLPEQKEETLAEAVDQDRRYTIDAWIVRFMKRSKMFPLQELVLECTEQLEQTSKFKPDLMVIKRCVESLIEREFLERDKGDPRMLRYLA